MKVSAVLCCALLASSLVAAQGSSSPAAPAEKEHHSFWCKPCNVFVAVFKRFVKIQEVVNVLEKFVEDHLCSSGMSESVADECVKMISAVVPAIINFLDSLSSSTLCSSLHVCHKDDLRMIAFQEQQLRRNQEVSSNSLHLCYSCKKFASLVKTGIAHIDTTDVMSWQKTLRQVCGTMSTDADTKKECIYMVDNYGYLLIYFLGEVKEAGDIMKICGEMGLCPRPSPSSAVPPLPLTLVQQIAGVWIGVNGGDRCERCKGVAKNVEGKAGDPGLKEKVDQYIDSVCSLAPPIKDKCSGTLTAVTDQVFDAAATLIPPEAICNELGFCGDGDVPDDLRMALDMDLGFDGRIVYVQ